MPEDLFNENNRYKRDAQNLNVEAIALLKPLFDEYIKKEYKPREISHIIMLSIMDIEMEHLVKF